MKTALLVASFGTTHLDTLAENIVKTEEALGSAFPDCPVYRAFTSGIVRSRLKSKYDITVDDVEGTLTKIGADGFTHVILQPTLLIPGDEYDLICEAVQKASGPLTVSIGRPLLCDSQDLDTIISVLEKAYPVDPDTILLLMGHGSSHAANRLYEELAQKMREHTNSSMRLCTVEGTPTFEDAIQELIELPHRKVRLAPLLLVAGDHAKNDMAGEEPDSLRSLLTSQGFEVECVLQGLGQLDAVRQLYIERAVQAKNF